MSPSSIGISWTSRKGAWRRPPVCGRLRASRRHGHQRPDRWGGGGFVRAQYGRLQGCGIPRGDRGVLSPGGGPGVDLERARPLPHEHPGVVGVERTRLPYWTTALSITVRSAPTGLTVDIWRCSATGAPYARTPRWLPICLI